MPRNVQIFLFESPLCAGCGKTNALGEESFCQEWENKLAEIKNNHPDPLETHPK